MNNGRKSAGKSRQRATVGAVLGGDLSPEEIKPEWRKYYRRLVELRVQLLKESGDLLESSQCERPVNHMHRADDGLATHERELSVERLSSDTDELLEIEEAIHRIVDGTYGVCRLTGRLIPAKRLDAIPWTAYTAEAQAKIESGKA